MKTPPSLQRARNFRPPPWPLRWITWTVAATQFLVPFSSPSLAAVAATVLSSRQPAPVETVTSQPAPRLVAINRTVSNVQRPPANASFSDSPTDGEISRAHIFTEPLVPTGQTTAEENKALALALQDFLRRSASDEVSALTHFLDQFPGSPWRVSLLTDLGIVYRRTGHFSKALAAWEEAWALGKSQTEPTPRAIADRAAAELAELNASVGRCERLEPLLAELAGRTLHGQAAEKVEDLKRGLWLMRHHPERTFRCGALALDRILVSANATNAHSPKILQSRSTTNGMSLAQVAALAKDVKLDYQMAKRAPGATVPLPVLVHWMVGHYGALIKEDNGRYLVHDPAIAENIWITRAALDDEASGYFLVPAGPLPDGWAAVAAGEGASVWGKGQTHSSDLPRTKCYDQKVPPCKAIPCPGGARGMADYAFHTMLVSLNIVDTPIGYAPPRGPAVRFTLTYNQREANSYLSDIPSYGNLGHQWTFAWFAFITDDPNSPAGDAACFLPGGGTEPYSGFDTNTSSYAPQMESHAVLVRTSSSSYERRLPDGSKQIFDLPNDPNASPRNIFLTQEIDPAGNTLTYTYDTNFCLVAATDALGQVTTLSYDLPGDTHKITKVTDPFGRFATFDYAQSGDGVWQLVKITDPAGITSAFTYSGDFITSLTTPYGTTTFAGGQDSTTRWLEATDPLGQTEHLEYHDTAPGVPDSEATVPQGLGTVNQYLSWRNSFYWDKRAWHDFPGDFTKAHLYHFLHTSADTSITSGILESDKAPLENRVWRNYPGQSAPNWHFEGTNGSPSKIDRVLDDGTDQLFQYQYNDYGKVTSHTDPAGRTTTNIYAPNGLDLSEVRQVLTNGQQTLAAFTYNSQHLPLSATDASGQTTYFGYNSYGQLVAATNARKETLSLAYDASGYLTNLTGALPGATTALSYDAYGRVRTVTDSEGYTVTCDYDVLDRPVKVTYPDGTFRQTVYQWLDPILSSDRRGHWTSTTHDALRRVTDVRDSLNRLTHFDWCDCGSLTGITDPAGNITSWVRDLQGRVIAKIYPDSSQTAYVYENTTSRLKTVTDAMNQTTTYSYFADDNLQQVAYANAVNATPGVSFTYDTGYNRLLTMTDGTGTTTYNYYPVTDPPALGAGRLQSVDGPLDNDTIVYQYDELGRVSSRAINDVAVSLAYDSLGRVISVTNALGSFTNAYLNATFRLSSIQYPNGQSSTFSYFDNLGDQRLQTLWHKNSGGDTLSKFDYSYDVEGQIETWTRQADAGTPNVWAADYDRADQLLALTVHSNTIAGAILKQFVYGYDSAANRTSKEIQGGAGVPPAITTATYNNLNQLTSASAGGPMRFSGRLDKLATVTVAGSPAIVDSQTTNFVGYANVSAGTNAVQVVAADYSGNRRTNNYQIVVSDNGVARTLLYDLNGNLTNMTTSSSTNLYAWDAANRLIKLTQLSGASPLLVSQFTYDGLGRRVEIDELQNNNLVIGKKFVWCVTELCEERDASGANVTKRFFAQGQQNITLNSQPSTFNLFYTRDHLGSTREMTDGTGTIRARYDYGPYGRRINVQGDLDADFGFTGHYFHAPSRLHLALFRTYDADAGRWLNRDPIEEAGGINLYGYLGNDPIDAIDPLGLYNLWDFGGDTLNFAAGLGNAVSFGGTTWLAQQFMNSADAATLRRTKRCSGSFKAGEWASLSLGAGRLAYAGLAKGASMAYAARGATMANAAAASAFRNGLKQTFRLNPWSKFRIYPFEQVVEEYGTAEGIIAAAGRTDRGLNALGATAAAGGAATLATTDDCECKK